MARASAGRLVAPGAPQAMGDGPHGGARRVKGARHIAEPDEAAVSKARFEAVMQAARQSGLLGEKAGRIGGRVSPELVAQAKRQTGIETDTDLIEFALASIALEDPFAEAFKQARGKVDPELKLGF